MTTQWRSYKVKLYLKNGNTIERTFYSVPRMDTYKPDIICKRMGTDLNAVKSISAWEHDE